MGVDGVPECPEGGSGNWPTMDSNFPAAAMSGLVACVCAAGDPEVIGNSWGRKGPEETTGSGPATGEEVGERGERWDMEREGLEPKEGSGEGEKEKVAVGEGEGQVECPLPELAGWVV